MAKKSTYRLLESMLGENVLIFLTNIQQQVQTEEGIIEVPLAQEGMILDMDENFLLVGNEDQTNVSLLNISNIAKIDILDDNNQVLNMDKPKKMDMN